MTTIFDRYGCDGKMRFTGRLHVRNNPTSRIDPTGYWDEWYDGFDPLLQPGVFDLGPRNYVEVGPLVNPTGAWGGTGALGGTVDVYLRSFAPFESFGLGFEGDNRGFTTDLDVTSRVSGKVTIDVTGQVVGTPVVKSRATLCAGPPCSLWYGTALAYAEPTIAARTVAGTLVVNMAGANPLVPFAPDIDLMLALRVTPSGFVGSLWGDAFPNAEVFIVGPGGARMLHTFTTSGGALTGPLWYLPGANRQPMGSFSVPGH